MILVGLFKNYGGDAMEAMLTAVCKHCRNFFVRTVETGDYIIKNGIINAKEPYPINQYIWLRGSALSDGIYKIDHTLMLLDGAYDEEFSGAIAGLAIPKDFLEIVRAIEGFQENVDSNPNAGLIRSETVGNHSYSYAFDAQGNSASWQNVFQSRLSPYKRMFIEAII